MDVWKASNGVLHADPEYRALMMADRVWRKSLSMFPEQETCSRCWPEGGPD